MRHGVIIRLHYQPDDPKFSWRFSFFQSVVLPRFLYQTNQDFEIWVICHPEHIALINNLSPKITACSVPSFPAPEEAKWGKKCEIPSDLPQFDIQTAHDSDDLISLNYIAKIKEEVEKQPGRNLIVSFQPYKLDLYTLKRYRMFERYRDNGTCSMFYSIYQPDKQDYKSIFNFDHSFISHWCNNIVHIPEGYCDMVIHGVNWMTGLQPNLGEVYA